MNVFLISPQRQMWVLIRSTPYGVLLMSSHICLCVYDWYQNLHRGASNENHKICLCGEIRKISTPFGLKKSTLPGGMPMDL